MSIKATGLQWQATQKQTQQVFQYSTLIIHFSKDWGWAKQQDLACE